MHTEHLEGYSFGNFPLNIWLVAFPAPPYNICPHLMTALLYILNCKIVQNLFKDIQDISSNIELFNFCSI